MHERYGSAYAVYTNHAVYHEVEGVGDGWWRGWEGGQWQDGSRGSDGIIVPSEGPDKIYTLHLHPYIRRGRGRKHALSPACGSADWYYDHVETYDTMYQSFNAFNIIESNYILL